FRAEIAALGPDGLNASKLLDAALAGNDASSQGSVGTGQAESNSNNKILVAYGSQTGTAEALARMTGLMAKSAAGLNPVVVSLKDLQVSRALCSAASWLKKDTMRSSALGNPLCGLRSASKALAAAVEMKVKSLTSTVLNAASESPQNASSATIG